MEFWVLRAIVKLGQDLPVEAGIRTWTHSPPMRLEFLFCPLPDEPVHENDNHRIWYSTRADQERRTPAPIARMLWGSSSFSASAGPRIPGSCSVTDGG